MMYYLHRLSDQFIGFNVFFYVTFRAVAAAVTALVLCLMLATDKMDLPVRLLMFSETSLRKRQLRFLLFGAFLAVGIIAAMIRPAFLAPRGFAKPAYMDRYNRDPYARSEWIDKCTVCHVGRGGAEARGRRRPRRRSSLAQPLSMLAIGSRRSCGRSFRSYLCTSLNSWQIS